MRTGMVTVLFVFVLAVTVSPAYAETAKEKCLKAAQADLAQCQKSLPPNVQPKDPKKPTDAEKEGMAKYTKAFNECNDKGSKASLACQ